MTSRRFAPDGLLALDPRAFGLFLGASYEPPSVEVVDGVAVLRIHGPLMHHADVLCDSYDAIRARATEALADRPRALVLSIDSPGGVVSGAFDTSRELRASAVRAGVPLVAHVTGSALSAGYALACAAERVYASPSALVGSIGIIDAIIDATAQDSALGLRFALVTSGARKADGNPHVPVTRSAIAAAQGRVDELAQVFFALVATTRGIPAARVAALEAGITLGPAAVAAGLVDELCGLDELLATLAAPAAPSAAPSAAAAEVRALEARFAHLPRADRDRAVRAELERRVAALEARATTTNPRPAPRPATKEPTMTTTTGALDDALDHLRAIAGSSTAAVSARRRARRALAAAGVGEAELEQLDRRASGKASCSNNEVGLVCHNPAPSTTDALVADFRRRYHYDRG